MTEERTTAARADDLPSPAEAGSQRRVEDMRIRGLGDKARQAHIRAIKDFAGFLKRSPDTATPDDPRAYQLHMTMRASRRLQRPHRGAVLRHHLRP